MEVINKLQRVKTQDTWDKQRSCTQGNTKHSQTEWRAYGELRREKEVKFHISSITHSNFVEKRMSSVKDYKFQKMSTFDFYGSLFMRILSNSSFLMIFYESLAWDEKKIEEWFFIIKRNIWTIFFNIPQKMFDRWSFWTK